jgi:tetratricopeptide (TPR) repeat protein
LAAGEGEGIDVDELAPLLAAVRDRELVFRREHSTFAGTEEYTFKHSLLRDVTYETVLLKLRRVYHRQVAQWLEKTAGERIGEHLSLIARHYELAGEMARAGAFWRRSGDELLRVSAFREAVRNFERALASFPGESLDRVQGNLSDADLAERATLLVKLGGSYNWVGDSLAAAGHLEQGLELAHQLDDPQLEIEALNKLAQIASEQGEFEKAQRYLDEVLALARKENDQTCVASTLAMLGMVAWKWGDIAQAEKSSHESLAIYRELGDRQKISQLLNILGILATLQKNYDRAERCYEQSLEIAREIDDRQLTASLLNNLGYLGHHCTGNLERAKGCYQESLSIAREIGHRHAVASTLNNLGGLHILLDERQSACESLREALIESADIGAVPLTLETLVGVVQLQTAVAEYASAAELLGLVLNHTALEMDVQQVAEVALDDLREVFPADQLEAGMEKGKTRELDLVIVEIEALIAKMIEDPI